MTSTESIGGPRIALNAIAVSKTNPRKMFDKGGMDELTESVKKHDILQPILVRPNGGLGKYELVAGERRFRAAQAAGLKDIPATVRQLNDAEVIEIQVIENLQRKDLHPLEEAEGYEALMKCKSSSGEVYTVDLIAKKIDKGPGYVYARLKLTALRPKAREAFYAGQLDSSRALLLARIPVPELQDKALEEILVPHYGPRGDEPMSFREAAEHLQDEYMLRLKFAPFKTGDATLVPSAGACTTCPKRSGNQPELFGDVKNADVCTDPKCFSIKRDAHFEQVKAAAIAKGKEVVTGKAAKDVVKLDEQCRTDPQWRTYRQILGNKAPTVLVESKQGDDQVLVEAVRKADVAPTLEKLKAANSERKEKERAARAGPTEEEKFREHLFRHVCSKLPAQLEADELRWIIHELLMGDNECEVVQRYLLPQAKQDKQLSPGEAQHLIEKALPKLDAAALSRLTIAIYLSGQLASYMTGEHLLSAAKRYGVDIPAVKAAAKAELAAEAKKAEEPKAKKPAKKAS